MYKKQFLWLSAFYISFLWFITFSKSVLPTHFLQQGLNLSQIMLGMLLTFVGQIGLILTVKKLSSKTAWRWALISWLVYIILVITIQSPIQFYLASIIGGFSIYLFYVFYNIAHFEKTPQENRGQSSALMFNIPTLISIIAPLLAGFLSQINILFLWIISIFSFLVAFYTVSIQDNFGINFKVRAAMKELKATRILLLIEGVWESLVIGIIPIYTLYFIKTPLFYGVFLSYFSLVSILANFTLGKLTDRLQKRVIFLYPLTIIMALVTFSFPFATQSITLWIVVAGATGFLLPLFWNISTAMIVDTHPDLRVAMPGRELLLGLGRIIGLSFAFLSFSYEKSPFLIFIVLGIILLLYPVTLYWNMYISKRYQYL